MKVNDKICQSCTAARGRDTSQSVLRLEPPPAVGREQMGFTGVRLLKGRLQDGNGGGGAGAPLRTDLRSTGQQLLTHSLLLPLSAMLHTQSLPVPSGHPACPCLACHDP